MSKTRPVVLKALTRVAIHACAVAAAALTLFSAARPTLHAASAAKEVGAGLRGGLAAGSQTSSIVSSQSLPALSHRLRNPEPRSHETAAAVAGGITEAARLSSAYDAILAARFDEARAQLARACPPAPAAACAVLREVALWWEIQQDLGSRRLDGQLQAAATSAIDAAAQWTEREPKRAEAWFFLAAAHAPLSQWRVLRGERLAAARDGKRMKDGLERALALDDQFHDAWFGIGLYHYYADVAPAAVKLLRFLLLLPGGDRVQGMREMLRARDRGELLRGEADYQLHWLYLWYEEQPERALELLRSLDTRYPSNPLFLTRIADVQREYFHDHIAAAVSWSLLAERARAGRVATASIAESRARLGSATAEIELGRPDVAIDLVTPIIRARSAQPYNMQALALLTLGDAHARAGHTTAARDAYARAIVSAVSDDPDDVRTRARRALTRLRSPR